MDAGNRMSTAQERQIGVVVDLSNGSYSRKTATISFGESRF